MGGNDRGLKFADAPEGFRISNSNNNNNISNKKEHLRNRRQLRKLPVSPMMLVTNGKVRPKDWVLLDGNTYTTGAKMAKKDKDKGIFGPRPKGNGGSPPTPAPFDSSNIDESETDGTGSDGESNAACLAVFSQEPVDAQASTRDFSISVDVLYQTDTTSSTEIVSHLDDQNLAMALWIAGCEEEAISLTSMDTAPGKRRKIQEVVVINYSQVDSWTTTDSCEEEYSGELMSSSSPLCKQEFTSTVQIQSTAEYVTTQIANAFETSMKPFLKTQEGVVAVAIDEIEEETRPDSNIDVIQTDETQTQSAIANANDNRRTIIIAGSIVGACGLVCIMLLALIGMYEKHRKTSHPDLGYRGRTHVPFVDAFKEDNDNSDEESSGREQVRVSNNKATPSDESDNDEEYDAIDDASEDIPPPPPSPCHLAPTSTTPALFDETPCREGAACSAATCQTCETKRQRGVVRKSRSSLIKAIDSSAPVRNVPMHITPTKMTSPRIARRPLGTVTSAEVNRRNYILEDLQQL